MKMSKRLICLLLSLALCLGALAPAALAAEPGNDGAAFGDMLAAEGAASVTALWTNDAMDAEALKALINSQELHPQRTGWLELDSLLDSMLQEAGSDAYSQLWYMYNWLVQNIVYSWEGYSYTTASVASYNSFSKDYLKDLTYEDGLQKSIPDDMANRTYHMLTRKRGVCYDYAIASAVIARYIGIDSYVHTGLFIFEDAANGAGHHGWAVLTLGGENYVFDPQRDARNWQYFGQVGYYFGIPAEKAREIRYNPDWYDNQAANAQRDDQMLPVAADRAHKVQVTAAAEGGTVSGQGSYITGTQATLTATPANGYTFLGWYDAGEQLLSAEAAYSFTVQDNTALTARFGAQVTVMVSRSGSVAGAGAFALGSKTTLTAELRAEQTFAGWYDINGNLLSQEPAYSFTVAQPQTLYALFDGDVFCDLKEDDWYLEDALESVERGLVTGVTAVTFEGEASFNRAMAVVMLARVDGASVSEAPDYGFADVTGDEWFGGAVNWAAAAGIVNGREENRFVPLASVTRQEFVAMAVRYLEGLGYELEAQELTYTDSGEIAEYAAPLVAKAQAIGLVGGYPDGSFQPDRTLRRSEAVRILLTMDKYLEVNPLPEVPAA